MAPIPHSRPENILKRAKELIGVDQPSAALNLLYEHVTSKRTRNQSLAALEPVMLLFVELCVEQRRGKQAKDGLYQYKNTAQNTNIGTIELVFKTFISLAEKKVTEAQAKADEVQSTLDAQEANVDDLEATETPESILLSTVSGEQSKDRTDRAIVTPWLKFLWETYRTVLEIFKNNVRLEVMYQATAHQAFGFCLKYTRKTEFRRLCELLRNHLLAASKLASAPHAINLNEPDTLQRHLDTRFRQLNVAVEIELWQEAFKSVEDIHNLLNLSKRPAKNIMMANYYDNLTRIFLVSENYLFHAAAWSRYYSLLTQSAVAVAAGQPKKENPSVTEADMSRAASFVILSALSIPVISTSRSRGALLDVDEARKNKHSRLTNILGMANAPTRTQLFKDALSKGLLKRCRPEIKALYTILEVDFHPLSICKKISPILSQIGSDPEMQKYVAPLQQVILTRLFQQLSQVYESVDLDFVLNLAQFPEPFQVSRGSIEKFIQNGCKKGELSIRVDHASGLLTFDTDVFSSLKSMGPVANGDPEASVQKLQNTPAEVVRTQLKRLAQSLYVTCQYVDPAFNAARVAARDAANARAQAGVEKEQREALARRQAIDQKKAAVSNAIAQKEKDLAAQKRQRAFELQAAEADRLAKEQREREARRIKAEQERIREEESQKALQEIMKDMKGVDISGLDPKELDSAKLRNLKLRALEKEKNELSVKLRATSKHIDHMERAFRKEEIKYVKQDAEEQQKRDHADYEVASALALKEAEERHAHAVELKHRLGRLLGPFDSYIAGIMDQRRVEVERRKKQAEKEFKAKKEARIREYRERKLRELQEKEEAELRKKEEEERRAREAEERALAEEERRKQEALEQASKPTAYRPPGAVSSRAPPAPAPGLDGGNWRTQKSQAPTPREQPSPEAESKPAPSTSKFVPSAMRRAAGGEAPSIASAPYTPPASAAKPVEPSTAKYVPGANRRAVSGAVPESSAPSSGPSAGTWKPSRAASAAVPQSSNAEAPNEWRRQTPTAPPASSGGVYRPRAAGPPPVRGSSDTPSPRVLPSSVPASSSGQPSESKGGAYRPRAYNANK